MGTASTYEQLPKPLQGQVDTLVRGSCFRGYDDLLGKVNGVLAAEGLELTFSRSALARHGKNLKDTIERVKAAHLAAEEIAQAFPESEERVSEAVIRVLQTQILEFAMRENVDPSLLLKLTRATADLTRADVAAKRYREEMRKKLDAKFKELEAESHPLSQSMDTRTLNRIREEIYGLFDVGGGVLVSAD